MKRAEAAKQASEKKLWSMWEALDFEVKTALEEWYNQGCLCGGDADDLRRLLLLWYEGRFEFWNCPDCGEPVQRGHPDDWRDFQGVLQPDYSSYPGEAENSLNEYFCDKCRSLQTGKVAEFEKPTITTYNGEGAA